MSGSSDWNVDDPPDEPLTESESGAEFGRQLEQAARQRCWDMGRDPDEVTWEVIEEFLRLPPRSCAAQRRQRPRPRGAGRPGRRRRRPGRSSAKSGDSGGDGEPGDGEGEPHPGDGGAA